MIRTQIYLTPALHQHFTRLARKNRTSMAREVRVSLEKQITPKDVKKTKKTKYKGAAGWLLKVAEEAEKMKYDGPKDLATNMDEYLYGDK